MVGAMDPYWGSLHCVRTLIVPLLTQMYINGYWLRNRDGVQQS